jgi:hypothetical protein
MSSTPTYRDRIEHIPTGAPGRASSVGSPDRQLEGNIQYLKAIVDSAQLGEAMYLRNRPVDPASQIGQPVYYNTATARYDLALAAAEAAPGGSFAPADSADCWGVIAYKHSSSTADILLLGVAPVDITAAVDGGVQAGRYYLSASQPGKLVQQRPPVSVFVLRATDQGEVFVNPDVKDFLSDHTHVSMELAARPAGDCEVIGDTETHVITSPDDSIRGWLPADHASFGGLAPDGAAFGYNLAAHSDLQSLWPPIPIEAVLLEMARSDAVNGQSQVAGRVSSELVQFDINGIWWMTDCYNHVPWPVDCSTTTSESSYSACPLNIEMTLILSFLKTTFQTG